MEFIVHNYELQGLDIIWRIAFEGRKQDVVDKCVLFLNQLYERVSPNLKVIYFYLFCFFYFYLYFYFLYFYFYLFIYILFLFLFYFINCLFLKKG